MYSTNKNKTGTNFNFFYNVLFADEAHFSQEGVFDHHNFQYPHRRHLRNQQRRWSVNVWTGAFRKGIHFLNNNWNTVATSVSRLVTNRFLLSIQLVGDANYNSVTFSRSVLTKMVISVMVKLTQKVLCFQSSNIYMDWSKNEFSTLVERENSFLIHHRH